MARRIFEAVIGIVLLVVAFVLAYLFQQAYKSGVEYQSLPVPVAEIPPYTMLSEALFEMKDFPSALSGGYAANLQQLVGKMSNSRIPAELPIPLVLVNGKEDFRLADPSLEVVSIPIDPSSAVGGQVRVGERVNIYRLIAPGGEFVPLGAHVPISESVTLVAESIPVVMVLGVDGSQAGINASGKTIQAHVLILAVTTDQLRAILNLMAETKHGAILWVTLAPIP